MERGAKKARGQKGERRSLTIL